MTIEEIQISLYLKCTYMRCLAILFFMNISIGLNGQEAQYSSKQELSFYADVMINALEAEHRMRAGDKFHSLFNKYLNEEKTDNDFSFIQKFIPVQTPEDSTFQLISWAVQAESFNYNYFAYVIMPDGSHHSFVDNTELSSDISYEEFGIDDWYGAMYYSVRKFGDDYLIFGKDANSEFSNQKVLDVLNIDGDKITLGKPIFENKEELGTYQSRICLSFSADAAVNLHYHSGLEMIIHDHLINRMGRIPGQGPAYLPDGSYEGYAFEEGLWKYKEKLYDHSYGKNNAPRPKPILNTNRKLKKGRK